MEDKLTTISIMEMVKKELDKKKIHPRQSYNEVICEILGLELPRFLSEFISRNLITNPISMWCAI